MANIFLPPCSLATLLQVLGPVEDEEDLPRFLLSKREQLKQVFRTVRFSANCEGETRLLHLVDLSTVPVAE